MSCRLHAETLQRFLSHARTAGRLLTDPMPESLPESLVCVLLLASESVFTAVPPTGQSILALIWLDLVPLWADSASWLVPLFGGVTVMFGSELNWPKIFGVDWLSLYSGYFVASEEILFLTRPSPGQEISGGPKEGSWSEAENLLIRSLMLPARCRFELRERPEAGPFRLSPQACSASSSRLSDDAGGDDSGLCWKRRTQ